jgi:glycosyltransferase involved in cell wall biosynthesis
MLFIGQLISLKGLDLFLGALHRLRDSGWRLTVIGDGPERKRFLAQTRRAGLGTNVEFLGALPNREAMQVLAASDLLVLPSRRDGWGMVINEALVRGVPVICSDRCGAADLVAESGHGRVFANGDVSALAGALAVYLRDRRRDDEPGEIRSWARCLSGASGARYLVAAVGHLCYGGPRPVAPWLEKPGNVPACVAGETILQ